VTRNKIDKVKQNSWGATPSRKQKMFVESCPSS